MGITNQPDFVLYHAWASSASRKVRLCMAEKGLSFRGLVLDLNRFQHHSDWYKRLNPSGIVPCLLVDARPLVEKVAHHLLIIREAVQVVNTRQINQFGDVAAN